VSAFHGILLFIPSSLEFLDEWDVLIIYKLDRGFRNHLDFVTFYHEFCERYGKKIISVGEAGLDMSTPMGRMFAGILTSDQSSWRQRNDRLDAQAGWAPMAV
jgi:hypothetical protein